VLYGGWGKDHLLDYRHDHEYADPEPLPGSDDLLFGGPGNDGLTATAGDDFLSGGPGIDSLVNSHWNWDDYSYEETLDHGSDTYLGGDGDDRIETIDGVAGNATVNGGEGIDACLGDEGDTIGACEGEYSPPD
jgi:Ca2+-binding RTX toxin-like protein